MVRSSLRSSWVAWCNSFQDPWLTHSLPSYRVKARPWFPIRITCVDTYQCVWKFSITSYTDCYVLGYSSWNTCPFPRRVTFRLNTFGLTLSVVAAAKQRYVVSFSYPCTRRGWLGASMAEVLYALGCRFPICKINGHALPPAIIRARDVPTRNWANS